MGLDTTHNCWHGPYTSFHDWRCAVAKAAGIPDLEQYHRDHRTDSEEHLYGLYWNMPKGGPLAILLRHADNEGYILAHHCEPLADALTELLPNLDGPDSGDDWSMYQLTERFIEGLRDAAENGQNVEFH